MLKGKDIINTAQFSLQELDLIMNTAASFEKRVKDGEVIKNMEGQVVSALFFEPSTRTRLSFETAANRCNYGSQRSQFFCSQGRIFGGQYQNS
jgi:aspartate carbamoyltransferase catalytic subunit